jgi:hypothetical protein
VNEQHLGFVLIERLEAEQIALGVLEEFGRIVEPHHAVAGVEEVVVERGHHLAVDRYLDGHREVLNRGMFVVQA